MTSRRDFLLGAAGTFALGTPLLAACGDGPEPSVTGSSTPTQSSTASVPADVTVPPAVTVPPEVTVPADVSVPAPRVPWQDADFVSLDSFVEQTNGEALAIWEDGTLVHEWYRTDESYTRDIASAQKSILSLLVGRAIGDGLVLADTAIDAVLGTGWTPHGQSSAVTVEHLLSMTSGLDDARRLVAAPGERWLYSGVFAALFDVLTTVTGRELNDIANDWLLDAAGASNSAFYERPVGGAAPIGLRSTVPDLIAIGRLVLDGGPDGLADRWLDGSFAPSQAFNRSYGWLWWLNGQESFMLPGRSAVLPGPLVPTAPAGMVAALGKDDQKLYLVPEYRLVVARLGGRAVPASEAARSTFDVDLWERLGTLRG